MIPRPDRAPGLWPRTPAGAFSSLYDPTGPCRCYALRERAKGDLYPEVPRRVVGPLAGVGHHCSGEISYDRGDISAGVDHERDPRCGEVLGPTPRLKLPQDRSTGVNVDIDERMWAAQQRHQALELGERKVGSAETNSHERGAVRHSREFANGTSQVVGCK